MELSSYQHDQARVLDLHILRGGAISVNGRGTAHREFEMMISQGAINIEVVIRSDPDVAYGDFMCLLDIIERAIAEGSISRENVYIWGRSARRW